MEEQPSKRRRLDDIQSSLDPSNVSYLHTASKRAKWATRKGVKQVTFAADDCLEEVIEIAGLPPADEDDGNRFLNSEIASSHLTEEMALLSSLHGRERRKLRHISKDDLKTCVKHGQKKRAGSDPITGLLRWSYTYGNIVCITDHTSTQEVTSFYEPIKITPATITPDMEKRHEEVAATLKKEPQLCTSHTIIVVDQSGSMRNSDVHGFRSRSHAAYGCLALNFLAEQLYDQSETRSFDVVTLIEMNDYGTILFQREPMDWILFNRVLDRQSTARPRSHGYYYNSLQVAKTVIEDEKRELLSEIDDSDHPPYILAFLSDGAPSDRTGRWLRERQYLVASIARRLKSRFTFFGMGIGPPGSDFTELKRLCTVARQACAKGKFVNGKLSACRLGEGFSFLSSTLTAMRTELLEEEEVQESVRDRQFTCVPLNQRSCFAEASFVTFDRNVRRLTFNRERWGNFASSRWEAIQMKNEGATGFRIDQTPFARGRERIAHRFQEVAADGQPIGKVMCAKDSVRIYGFRAKEGFFKHFIRIQREAAVLAEDFNVLVKKMPGLRPVDESESIPVPTMRFLTCHIYRYKNHAGRNDLLLVEEFLHGKFKKYSDNKGFVAKNKPCDVTIQLTVGEVYLADFLHAFSHWSFFVSRHKLLVCDLQGVLNAEGRSHVFQLTDAAICSTNDDSTHRRYGKTDLGRKGFDHFCRSHRCNRVCVGLGLRSLCWST